MRMCFWRCFSPRSEDVDAVSFRGREELGKRAGMAQRT